MYPIKIQSRRILERTFRNLKSQHIDEIEALLIRLSLVRQDKHCLGKTFSREMGIAKTEGDIVRQCMIVYLAGVTLTKPDNRRFIRRFAGRDLSCHRPELYKRLLKITQLDYEHFKNVLDLPE